MGKKKGDRPGKRIPKRIGGVKLPKALRRKGEALIDQAGSPEGQAAIARGLTIAAGLANLAAERARKAKTEPIAAANDPAPAPPLDPAKVAQAVSTVANEVLGRLFAGRKG